MAIEIIGKHPIKNGVRPYRVNGSYDDLYTLIAECRINKIKFADTPIVNPLRKGQWTVLLKVIVEDSEVQEVDKYT